MSTRDLLLEIGVEELPASFVDAGIAALTDSVPKKLAELRLTHRDVRVFATPRRLAVLVAQVAEHQPDLEEEVNGPPVTAAFDKEGKPTRAAEAFASKIGVTMAELRKVETPKGVYLCGTKRAKGRPAIELLGDALSAVIQQIPFRKAMRWGNGEGPAFGRPMRWIVALFGQDVISNVKFAYITAGRTSYGHRFLSPGAIEISAPDQYESQLAQAHVVANAKARADQMIRSLHEAAKQAGGELIEDNFLVGENLHLIEEPHVIVGGFEDQFLELPEEVILEVSRGHQRYFCVRGANGALLPKYLAVVNTANHPENIRRGNDRVMRARLSDAQFFFTEDRKHTLESRTPRLDGIVFHNRLGTVGAKVMRLVALVDAVGRQVNASDDLRAAATRGALLCKCDLVSLMVGEFPELQGIMGRAYALHHGEPEAVADVIRDHYCPKGAHDSIASAAPSALVALADRLDSLVGCFSVGLTPTGAADPYGLRRACLAILRTLLGHKWDVDITPMLAASYAGFVSQNVKLDLDESACVAKVLEFTRDRLRGALADDLPGDVVEACLAVASSNPVDTQRRAVALAGLDANVRAKLGEVFKRAANIAKDAPDGAPVDPASLETSPHASEVALWSAFGELDKALERTIQARDYSAAFASVASFAPVLDRYFIDVFVMSEVEALRNNRLRMMRALRDTCSKLAHIQLLQGTSAS